MAATHLIRLSGIVSIGEIPTTTLLYSISFQVVQNVLVIALIRAS